MKIGIIIYSKTGNTWLVGEKIKEKLLRDGHIVDIFRLEIIDEISLVEGKTKFKSLPEINDYDVIIFGTYVEAFSLNPTMKEYLNQVESLKEKVVGCFVTQHFPYPWMGGNRAIKQMKKRCEIKGAIIYETGIVNWGSKKRNIMIKDVVKLIGENF
jgi:flavodoxin